ncbi:hypothetical protein Bca4012_096878 [Brassica carinata]
MCKFIDEEKGASNEDVPVQLENQIVKMKLPCELVEEILYRVPPLSLLRCKTVCKQWNTLLNHLSLVRPQLPIWTGPKIYSVGVNLKDDPKIDIRELHEKGLYKEEDDNKNTNEEHQERETDHKIMANIRVQKGPESPRTEVGEIDTRAPFQSVKAAVSLFGEVVSRQRSTTRRSRLSSESVCDKETQLMLAHKQFLKIKQKLDNAEITRSRALSDLSNAKKTMEELTNKLEAVNKSKQSAIDTKETVQQREDQLEHDKSHGSPPHHHELDVAREQYLSTTIELDAAKQQLNKIKQSFDSAMDLKATALNQAAEAKRALQVNSAKVNELSKEIGDMKDAIHQLKLAATQNLEEYANIVKEKDDLRECYKTAVEEAEKKLLVLRKEYQPELSRNLEAKLIETTSEIEVLREEMKKAHESEMNTVKIITNELNEATMKLQEAADEEGSLRNLVNSLRMELEDMRREREELQQREAERLEVEERKKVEALKEESLRLEEKKQEALVARNEAEEMNRKIENLKKETDSAMIAAEEAEKRLELVIKEVEEAKAAEEKVREEMKMISQKQESKKQDEESSGSKIKITVQEFESLKRGAGETEKAVEKKLGDIAAELEEINKRKAEADNKLGASLKAIEEMKHATDLAQKAADSAEAAKSVVESELKRWRQKENYNDNENGEVEHHMNNT